MDDDDRRYFARRESEARQRAASCIDPSIAAIHTEMAEQYALWAGGDNRRYVPSANRSG